MKAIGLKPMLEAQVQAAIRSGQRSKLQVEQSDVQRPTDGPGLQRLLDAMANSEENRPAAEAGGREMAPRLDGTQLPVWLPVPLPDGNRGWVQLSVQERPAQAGETDQASTLQRVRLLWETPRLGTVQVVLEGAEGRLSAVFTALAPATRQSVDRELSDLKERLASAGFPDALVGSRQPLLGERLEPAAEPSALLDRRM